MRKHARSVAATLVVLGLGLGITTAMVISTLIAFEAVGYMGLV